MWLVSCVTNVTIVWICDTICWKCCFQYIIFSKLHAQKLWHWRYQSNMQYNAKITSCWNSVSTSEIQCYFSVQMMLIKCPKISYIPNDFYGVSCNIFRIGSYPFCINFGVFRVVRDGIAAISPQDFDLKVLLPPHFNAMCCRHRHRCQKSYVQPTDLKAYKNCS